MASKWTLKDLRSALYSFYEKWAWEDFFINELQDYMPADMNYDDIIEICKELEQLGEIIEIKSQNSSSCCC